MVFIKQATAGLAVKGQYRKGGSSDATFYKWRAKYGGIDAPTLGGCANWRPRLKELLAEAYLGFHALNTAFGVKR